MNAIHFTKLFVNYKKNGHCVDTLRPTSQRYINNQEIIMIDDLLNNSFTLQTFAMPDPPTEEPDPDPEDGPDAEDDTTSG